MITLALFAIALVIIVAISINVITKVKDRKSYINRKNMGKSTNPLLNFQNRRMQVPSPVEGCLNLLDYATPLDVSQQQTP